MKKILRFLAVSCLCAALALPSLALAQQAGPKVKLTTTKGDIVIELYPDKAPASVENFLKYVKDGYYDGTIFHRVISGFMIQGGGMNKAMEPKTGRPPIKNEADNGLKNDVYTVAMARTSDPHSATSQFYINVKDNASLNHSGKTPQGWGYAVFGKVVEGREVVDAIKAVPTTSKGPFGDVPVSAVEIVKAVVVAK